MADSERILFKTRTNANERAANAGQYLLGARIANTERLINESDANIRDRIRAIRMNISDRATQNSREKLRKAREERRELMTYRRGLINLIGTPQGNAGALQDFGKSAGRNAGNAGSSKKSSGSGKGG